MIVTHAVLRCGNNIRSGIMGNAMKILNESTSLTGRDKQMLHTGIPIKQPRKKRKTVA
jgi:hypothetical protein